MNKDTTFIQVSIVEYQPDVRISIPMAFMGPATISVAEAKKLRDALDTAIEEFENKNSHETST